MVPLGAVRPVASVDVVAAVAAAAVPVRASAAPAIEAATRRTEVERTRSMADLLYGSEGARLAPAGGVPRRFGVARPIWPTDPCQHQMVCLPVPCYVPGAPRTPDVRHGTRRTTAYRGSRTRHLGVAHTSAGCTARPGPCQPLRLKPPGQGPVPASSRLQSVRSRW